MGTTLRRVPRCCRGFLLGVVAGGLAFAGMAHAGPPNDNCANAQLISCNGSSIIVDNSGATPAVGPDSELPLGTPTCHWNNTPNIVHNTLWYRFQATNSQVFISTCGTESLSGTPFSDSVIGLYQGANCGSLIEIACGEDDCDAVFGGRWLSELCYDGLQVGQTYTIMVGNTGGPASVPGTLQLDVSCPCPGPPVNDECATALTAFTGNNAFSNRFATDSGPDHGAGGACAIGGDSDIRADVWFRWTATSTADATFTLCTDTDYDAKMAIYSGNLCPPPQDGSTLIACNDDGCGINLGPSLIEELPVVAGTQYLIRIGGFQGDSGDGILGISNPPTCGDGVVTAPEECDPPGPGCDPDCTLPSSSVCIQVFDHPPDPDATGVQGSTSDLNGGFTVADSFQAAESGSISQLCWAGLYFDFQRGIDCGPGPGDNFTVTYYQNDQGLPGALLGQFPLTNVQKTANDLVDTGLGPVVQYEYTSFHPAVSVTAGVCYWIEITNTTSGNCFWLWKTALPGDGVSAQDSNLNGYDRSEREFFDLAFAINIDTAPADCAQSCCFPGVSCEDDISVSDCLQLGGDFTTGTTCVGLNPQCGFGACCQPDGGCSEGLAGNCDGQFHVNTTCAEIICNLFNDCGWDNGISDTQAPAARSQFAPKSFSAEAADNFIFKGDTGNCVVEEIVVFVTHDDPNRCFDLCACPNGTLFQSGIAADVCGTGDPNDCVPITRGLCSDGTFCYVENTDLDECGGLGAGDCTPHPCTNTPDDYRSVRVTIYPDVGSTPGGFPTNDTVPCISNADCEPLAGGTGAAVCSGNICFLGAQPAIVPTGTHTGAQFEIVVPPDRISWQAAGADFEVTLDMTFLSPVQGAPGLPILQNQKKWISIAPEVQEAFFYKTRVSASQNFDGEPSEHVFSQVNVFPFSNFQPTTDLAFELVGQTQTGGPIYERGDCDGNGTVNFLSDDLFLLNFGFVPGSPFPPCFAAADVDGNQMVNALADALFGLNAGFVPGSPLPPAPFGACGPDPVGIGILGCNSPPPCP